MNKKNLISVILGLVSAFAVLAFNNCAQRIDSPNKIDMSSSALSGEKDLSLGAQFASTNDPVVVAANKSLLDMLSATKLFVSNSANGPFVENGSVCLGKDSYYKTVGVNPNLLIKGCASPLAALGCLDATKHRKFEANEWVSGNIVTKITAAESWKYPPGDYAFYLSGSNKNTTLIQKVGVATMKSCSGIQPAPVTPKSCLFEITNPQAVVGGGVNIYPFTCDAQHENQSGNIHYDAGASSKDFNGICRCR